MWGRVSLSMRVYVYVCVCACINTYINNSRGGGRFEGVFPYYFPRLRRRVCWCLRYKKKKTRQRRPRYVKRDWYIWSATYVHGERYVWKSCELVPEVQNKTPSKRPVKRDWQIGHHEMRPTYTERDLYVWKSCELVPGVQNKRNLKKDLHLWKETYVNKMRPVYVERHLLYESRVSWRLRYKTKYISKES